MAALCANVSKWQCKVQSGTFTHLVASSDLACKIETVTELCTKKHDVSLGGDVRARLNSQTARHPAQLTLSSTLSSSFVPCSFWIRLLPYSQFMFLRIFILSYFLSVYHFSLSFIFLPFPLALFLYPYAVLFSCRLFSPLIFLPSLFCSHLFVT